MEGEERAGAGLGREPKWEVAKAEMSPSWGLGWGGVGGAGRLPPA